MTQKIRLGDREYNADDLSEKAQEYVSSLNFATQRVQELTNLEAILRRAKRSYMKSLKNEIISKKSGLLIEDD